MVSSGTTAKCSVPFSSYQTISEVFLVEKLTKSRCKLVINVYLPGKGNVFLRNLKLIQITSSGAGPTHTGSGWSDRMAAVVGGIGGVLIGCLGAVIEWLTVRGKAQ